MSTVPLHEAAATRGPTLARAAEETTASAQREAGASAAASADGDGTGAEGGAVAVANARQEIRALVAEVARIAKTDVDATEFFEVLLSRTVAALAASGGAVWRLRDDGVLALEVQINYRQTGLVEDGPPQQRHTRLLRKALAQDKGLIVAPHSGVEDDEAAGNDTEHLLILTRLGGEQPQAVLEIFQRPGAGPVTQRGYLRFVDQMGEIATDFLKSRRLRQYEDRQALWSQLNDFTRALHRSLDPRRTAYTIATEGRRLLECERVSLAVRQGRRCGIAAVSNQDSPDRRSNVVTSLARLAERVVAAGEPVWFSGDARHLPPQVEEAIDAHVDLSHAKAVAVLPLVREPEVGSHGTPRCEMTRRDVIGALLIERFDEARFGEGLTQRAELLRDHAAVALSNALDHHGPLMPLVRWIGRTRLLTVARNLPRTLLAAAAVATLLVALFFLPADFQLEARGTLEPTLRREVFVQEGGLVTEVLADHGQFVTAGAPLVQLQSRDLDVQITGLNGQRQTTEQQMAAISRQRNNPQLSADERDRLAGELKELRETFDSLTLQIDLLETKQQLLTLTSPIDGEVVTWDARRRLLRRPVEKGQLLLTVADPRGPWELELKMREDRMGHVGRAAAAARERGEPLAVEYILATEPGRSRAGKVTHIQSAAELRGQDGNTVLIRVAPQRADLADVELRPGASVTAKIDCGRRSLGYVWFHDVLAFLNSRVLFRL